MGVREQLQEATRRVDAPTIATAVAMAKRGKPAGQLQLAAVMAWVGYACPDATEAVYDNICSNWLGYGPTPNIPIGLPAYSIRATV
jgi:hypothetical protein